MWEAGHSATATSSSDLHPSHSCCPPWNPSQLYWSTCDLEGFLQTLLFPLLEIPCPLSHSAKEWWYMPSVKHYVPCKMLIITAHRLHVILTTTLSCWPHSVILSRLFSWLLLQKVLIRIIWDAPEERLVQCWGWGALHRSCHCPFHWPPRADGTSRFDVHREAVGLCDQGCRFPKAVPGSPPSLALSSFSRSHQNRLVAFRLLLFLKNKFVCSVAKACPILCNPMDCSMPGFSVLHHLLEFAQTYVHWVTDTIQPSHLLLPTSCPASGSFPMSQLFASDGQSIGASASASVLPVNIQSWFPVGLTGSMSLLSKGLARIFSSTTVGKHRFVGAQPSLWSSSHIHPWLLEKLTP